MMDFSAVGKKIKELGKNIGLVSGRIILKVYALKLR